MMSSSQKEPDVMDGFALKNHLKSCQFEIPTSILLLSIWDSFSSLDGRLENLEKGGCAAAEALSKMKDGTWETALHSGFFDP